MCDSNSNLPYEIRWRQVNFMSTTIALERPEVIDFFFSQSTSDCNTLPMLRCGIDIRQTYRFCTVLQGYCTYLPKQHNGNSV